MDGFISYDKKLKPSLIEYGKLLQDLKKKFFFNVYLFFERQSMRGEGAEGEGDTESEAGSRL